MHCSSLTAKTTKPYSKIDGFYVNGVLISGSSATYTIPKGIKYLEIQASEIVTKEVFSDPENSKKTTISITHPGWTNKKKEVRVKISAKNSGTGIDELTAKTDTDDSWEDVLSDGYLTLTENTTVTVLAISGAGDETKKSRFIEWFDDAAPIVSASLEQGKARIVVSDKASGVAKLYVSGQAFEASELDRGSLMYSIPDGVSKLTVQAEDVAGNRSRMVELTVSSAEKLPVKPIPPARSPGASVVKATTDDASEEQPQTDDEARKAELLRLLKEKRAGANRVVLTEQETELMVLDDSPLPLSNVEADAATMKEPRMAVLIGIALAFWALVVIVILIILRRRKEDSVLDDE